MAEEIWAQRLSVSLDESQMVHSFER